jgi:hypothetical protein
MVLNRKRSLKILDLSEGDNPTFVKRRSKELLKKYHPDKHRRHSGWAQTQTKRILEATELLLTQKEVINQKPLTPGIRITFSQARPKVIMKETIKFFQLELISGGESFQLGIDVTLIDQVLGFEAFQKNPAHNDILDLSLSLNIEAPSMESQVLLFYDKDRSYYAIPFINGGSIIEVPVDSFRILPNDYLNKDIVLRKSKESHYFLSLEEIKMLQCLREL